MSIAGTQRVLTMGLLDRVRVDVGIRQQAVRRLDVPPKTRIGEVAIDEAIASSTSPAAPIF